MAIYENTNLQEDYVSFETAKLLKEKGFDEGCRAFYVKSKECGIELFHAKEPYNYNNNVHPCTSAPTLQMVMKWLREVHNLFIGINTVIGSDKNWGYEVFIQKQEVPIPSKIQWDWFNTYEEACEAAIKYCLENLI